jgi:hypothetical protein
VAPFFRLSLDNANRLLVEEQDVVRRADIGLVFANGNARTGIEIYGCAMLYDPARLCQLGVNLVTSTLFRVLVRGGH